MAGISGSDHTFPFTGHSGCSRTVFLWKIYYEKGQGGNEWEWWWQQTAKDHADARKVHADAEKTEDLPKNHEKGSETVNFDNQEKQARCRAQAAIWYENEGFERIQAIRKTLESENRNRFSVNREGICSISIGKRNLEPNFRQTKAWMWNWRETGNPQNMECSIVWAIFQ